MPVFEKSKITVSPQHLFKNIFCYGRFRYVPSLSEKVFSRAPVECFSLYGSNNSDSVVFGNGAFGEIKDHSLRTTPSQKKKFDIAVSIMCLPYVKMYFQSTSKMLFYLWLK